MFKYPEDRFPVIVFLLVTVIDFALYFTVDVWWVLAIYWLVMIMPKGKICAFNHHHQHTFTFKSKPMNRLLEIVYALHTGVTTHLWVLHHVLGHHHNFLDQELDESRWKRKNGEPMGELEYTLNVGSTAYYRGYLVGKKHPKLQKEFISYGLLVLAIVVGLVWYKPVPGLFLFVLPMITGLYLTAWATFAHHAGLDTQDEFAGSYNNLNPTYNKFSGNLGYHTAHHHKQGVHWSKLPELHDKIKDKIPAELITDSWF